MAPPYGDGRFKEEPPSGHGINISDIFKIVTPKPNDPGIKSAVDSEYPNVAIITFDETNQFGGMWAKQQLDLTLPFHTEMYLHLGHQYDGGGEDPADGMTFTLHNDPDGLNAIGGAGEGLGVYKGRKWVGPQFQTAPHGVHLKNSLVIEFDTYKNISDTNSFMDDPGVEGTSHCSLIIPESDFIRIMDHRNTFFFTPTQQWEKFTATWTPDDSGGGALDYTFKGNQRIHPVADIISTFGDTKVFWGFTGATGQLTSVQAAAITTLPAQGIVTTKTVKNEAGEDIDQNVVFPGDIIQYAITIKANLIFNTIGPIIIDDVLSEYVDYVDGDVQVTTKDGSVYNVPPTFIGNAMNINTDQYLREEGDYLEVTFRVKVKDSAGDEIAYNQAVISADGLAVSQETNTTKVTVFSNPEKSVSNRSEAGQDGTMVKTGDRITYDIIYMNYLGTAAPVAITDTLPAGVDFVSATNGGVYNGTTHTVTWTLANVPSGVSGTVSLVVQVNEDAVTKIENYATVQVGDDDPMITNTVINLIILINCPKIDRSCRKTITGCKIWADNDNANNTRPDSVEIVLLRDGEIYRSKTLDSTGDGIYIFTCLPVWKNSEDRYNYKIDEPEVPGNYTKEIDGYNVINTLTMTNL